MPKKYLFLLVFSILLLMCSCSKKHHPGKTPTDSNANVIKPADSLSTKKVVAKPKRKEIVPKLIAVNDSVAHKSIDGRLYYDLLGKRYWKNYKDGKYYLYNKSMYTNDAFKKPE